MRQGQGCGDPTGSQAWMPVDQLLGRFGVHPAEPGGALSPFWVCLITLCFRLSVSFHGSLFLPSLLPLLFSYLNLSSLHLSFPSFNTLHPQLPSSHFFSASLPSWLVNCGLHDSMWVRETQPPRHSSGRGKGLSWKASGTLQDLGTTLPPDLMCEHMHPLPQSPYSCASVLQ